MMDCDTTGVEPDIALVKYKKLVGGGMIKIVNQTVPLALKRLGYEQASRSAPSSSTSTSTTRSRARPICKPGAPAGLRLRLQAGEAARARSTTWATSRCWPRCSRSSRARSRRPSTCPRSRRSTRSWRPTSRAGAGPQGGRDLPRRLQAQPAAVDARRDGTRERSTDAQIAAVAAAALDARARRRKLPDERRAHHPQVLDQRPRGLHHGRPLRGRPAGRDLPGHGQGGLDDLRPDGRLRHLRSRSRSSTACRCKALVDKFTHTRFEPSGFTKNPEIPIAKSITDYIFRWLASKFLSTEEQAGGRRHPARRGRVGRDAGVGPPRRRSARRRSRSAGSSSPESPSSTQQDAPSCHECGSIMVRNGSCYKCLNCGSTSGCS